MINKRKWKESDTGICLMIYIDKRNEIIRRKMNMNDMKINVKKVNINDIEIILSYILPYLNTISPL